MFLLFSSSSLFPIAAKEMSEQIDEGSRITSTRFFSYAMVLLLSGERKEGRSNIWLRFFLPLSLL